MNLARSNLNRNLVAALSYFLGFITGMVILIVEKEDKFVRFHAMQSTVVFVVLFVFNLVAGIIFKNLGPLGFMAVVINSAVSVVALVVWMVSMVKAFSGQIFKWPIVGDFAEKHLG